jgi:biotin carboxylase/ribosomal protein S18 acetylase RimI-like enzyme
VDQQILFVLGARNCIPSDPLAAARRMGYRSLVFTPRTPSCSEADLDLIDRLERVHMHRPDEALELARKFHAEQPIAAVVGYEEDATVLAAHLAKDLGLPTHPIEAAEAAMDKPTMKARFVAAGVPTADFIVAADEDDAVRWAGKVGYPVVVKPCRGSASQGVIRADNEPELRTAYRRLRRIVRDYGMDNGGRPTRMQLVERYLSGGEISVELLLQRGQAQVTAVFEKPRPLTGPFFEETIYMTPARLMPERQREVEELALRAASALGFYHGLAHCEIRLTEAGPYVLEIAGRLLGGVCSKAFRDRLGDDIHPFLFRLAMGEPVTLPPTAPDAPVSAAMMLPVPAEGRLVALHGVDQARRVPGIREVIVTGQPGDAIVPFPEQTAYPIGFLWASGPTHQAVEDALARASASISIELAPLGCDYWERPLDERDAAYQPPPGTTISRVFELPPQEARQRAVSYLVAGVFDELPPAEAAQAAHRLLDEEGCRGEPVWIQLDDKALCLGYADGDTGYLCCSAVLPEHRSRGIGTSLFRAQLAELARRGCTRVLSETDPRLPLSPPTLERVGFTRIADTACQDPIRVHSCGLTPVVHDGR